uniref:YTH domain-containing protein n=1 Tax=Heterorhabditis bacteriophora TaxID=37862 RepID=A0A1I7WKZ2_HETBA
MHFLVFFKFLDPRYSDQSINNAFYMGGMYNAGYTHEPYGHNVFIDPSSYGEPQQYPYYGGYSYGPYGYQGSAYPGAYGPYPGTSGAYRPFPQPQPSPPRRSRFYDLQL